VTPEEREMAKEMAEEVRKERNAAKQEKKDEKERETARQVRMSKLSGHYPGYGGGLFSFLKRRKLVRPSLSQVKKRRHNQQVQQAVNQLEFKEGVKALQRAQTLKKQGVASRHLVEDPRSRGHSNASNTNAEDPYTGINENAAAAEENVMAQIREAFKGRFPVAKNAKEVYERSAAPARAAASKAAAAAEARAASKKKANNNAASRRKAFENAANKRESKRRANEAKNEAKSKAKIAEVLKNIKRLEKTSGEASAPKKPRWGVSSFFSGTRKSPFTKGPSSGSKRVLVNNPLASKKRD
jgi:hypothetical protein